MKLANLLLLLTLSLFAVGSLTALSNAAASTGDGLTFITPDGDDEGGEEVDLFDNGANDDSQDVQLKPKKDKTFIVRVYEAKEGKPDEEGNPTWTFELVATVEYTSTSTPGFAVPAGGKATVEDIDPGAADSNKPQGDVLLG